MTTEPAPTKSLAERIKRPPSDKPPMGLIYGRRGMGKTSFAAAFPNPLILDVEKGSDFVDAPRIPIASYAQLLDEIKTLATDTSAENTYQTLIVDTITSLEPMIHAAIEAEHKLPLEKVNGGFFRWRSAARDKLEELLRYLRRWQQLRGGAVWIVGHETVTTFSHPETEPFDKYSLRVDKEAANFLIENLDLVGFLDQPIRARETSDEARHVGISVGIRRLQLNEGAATYDAKRRAPGLPEYIELPSAKQGAENFQNTWNNRNK